MGVASEQNSDPKGGLALPSRSMLESSADRESPCVVQGDPRKKGSERRCRIKEAEPQSVSSRSVSGERGRVLRSRTEKAVETPPNPLPTLTEARSPVRRGVRPPARSTVQQPPPACGRLGDRDST